MWVVICIHINNARQLNNEQKQMNDSDDLWCQVDELMAALDKDTNQPRQPTQLPGILYRMLKVQYELTKLNYLSSRRIGRLTWVLLLVTIALLGVALVQSAIMLFTK
jgi:hypothetical protein